MECIKVVGQWVKRVFRKREGVEPVYPQEFNRYPYYEESSDDDKAKIEEILKGLSAQNEVKLDVCRRLYKQQEFWGVGHDDDIEERLQQIIERLEDNL